MPAEGKGKSPARTPRRQYMPAEKRRKHILETAREVFARSGLKGARTRELAQAAGINQSTLFEHFSSKEELFIAAVVEPLAAMAEDTHARVQEFNSATSTEALQSMIETGMVETLQRTIEIYPLLVQGLFSDVELGQKLYREHIEPMLMARAAFTRDLIGSAIDPRLLQVATFGMAFAIAMDRTICGGDQDIAEVARQLSDLIAFGTSDEGRPAW